MKYLPIGVKLLLNLIILFVYWAFFSLLVGIFYGIITGTSVEGLLAQKIGIFVGVLVLLITLIFRKYFYIALRNPVIEKKESYTMKKAEEIKKDTFSQDDDIKIYIEKEIK